jgi:hypothetical protein
LAPAGVHPGGASGLEYQETEANLRLRGRLRGRMNRSLWWATGLRARLEEAPQGWYAP